VDKPSEVVVVNYNDNNNENSVDNDDTITSFGYDVTEVPAESSTSGSGYDVDYDELPPLHGLQKFVSREKMAELMNDYRLMMLSGDPESQIQEWIEHLFDRYGRRMVGTTPCTRRHGLYRADTHAAPYVGLTSACHVCSK